MDRHAMVLAENVPQRLIDAGDRAHEDRAAAVKTGAIHDLPVIFDVARVLADEVVGQFMDRGLHRVRAPFDDGLAPADDAFIGLDFEK